MNKCEGCQVEMGECYEWQKEGFNAGLIFLDDDEGEEHCYFFAMNDHDNLLAYSLTIKYYLLKETK